MPKRKPINIEVGKEYEDRSGLVHKVVSQEPCGKFNTQCYCGDNWHHPDGKVWQSPHLIKPKQWKKRDLVAEVIIWSARNLQAKYHQGM